MADLKNAAAIIMSSAYLPPGLVAEFGLLPPAFLPLANKRLYVWQVESMAARAAHIALTLPDDFVPEPFDKSWFEGHNVTITPIRAAHSLGRAVHDAVAALPKAIDQVWLLFGDTLVSNVSQLPMHGVAIGYVKELSHWGTCEQKPDGRIEFSHNIDTHGQGEQQVIAGCFRLDRQAIIDCLANTEDQFFKALSQYSAIHRMTLHDVQSGWYDFGHTNAYFQSRQNFTTQRTFNTLQITSRMVRKGGANTDKIAAEAAWYENIPGPMRVFVPNFLGQSSGNYATEYLYSSPISDLFVYGRFPDYVWTQILGGCQEFLTASAQHTPPDGKAPDTSWLYGSKTRDRLQQFAASRNIDLDHAWVFNGNAAPSLNQILGEVTAAITPKPQLAVMHGDFHFANIFFDFRSLGVKVVDPRGTINHQTSIYGDRHYDVAKLAHSIDGLYDFIVAGIAHATVTAPYQVSFEILSVEHIQKVQHLFGAMDFGGISPRSREIKAMVILLFMAMLPLHADNQARQDTMLANVLRLYLDFVE